MTLTDRLGIIALSMGLFSGILISVILGGSLCAIGSALLLCADTIEWPTR